MNDWAIGMGYSALYDTGRKRESQKEELGMLGVMQQQLDKEKLESEQDQLKQQAYMEQVSKFSDTLLAPDRDKINRKAKDMAVGIRENIKTFGGNMGKFLENGGHRVMADYKSAITNSEESSQYLDNKKNMDRIVDMQMKGFGHLLNPKDKANLQDYEKNKGGIVTYSGQMSEIEMPPASEYDYDEEIPTEDILYNKENYAKILGNYLMTYPENQNPSREDLIAFTNSQYKGRGSDWQRDLAYRKFQQESLDRLAKIAATKKEKEVAEKQLELGPNSKGYKAFHSTGLTEIMSRLPQKIKATEWNSNVFDQLGDQASQYLGSVYDVPTDDFIDGNDGDKSNLWANGYKPRGARYTKLNIPQAAKSWGASLGESVEGNVIKGVTLSASTRLFDPSGKRISDNDDDDVFGEKYDLTVDSIVMMGGGIDKNNKDFLLMDNVKGNWKGDPTKNIHNERQEKYNELLGESQIVPKRVMVLKDAEGHIFYHDIGWDNASNAIYHDPNNVDDETDILNTGDQRKREFADTKAITDIEQEEIQQYKQIINGNKKAASHVRSEINSSYITNPKYVDSGNRANLVKSFYLAASQSQGDPNIYEDGSKEQAFTQFMRSAELEGNTDYSKQLRNDDKQYSDISIIQKILENSEEQQKGFSEKWLAIYSKMY
jgi:hypothetical protein